MRRETYEKIRETYPFKLLPDLNETTGDQLAVLEQAACEEYKSLYFQLTGAETDTTDIAEMLENEIGALAVNRAISQTWMPQIKTGFDKSFPLGLGTGITADKDIKRAREYLSEIMRFFNACGATTREIAAAFDTTHQAVVKRLNR